jgi:hypothetical protein
MGCLGVEGVLGDRMLRGLSLLLGDGMRLISKLMLDLEE